MTISVQGFGNVGSLRRAVLFESSDVIDDRRRRPLRTLQPRGLQLRTSSRTTSRTGTARRARRRAHHARGVLGALKVDICAPCALENQYRRGERRPGEASISGGRQRAHDPVGDAFLERRLDPARRARELGRCDVSYFEWVQGLQEYFWKENEVNAKLNDIVSRAFEETWETPEGRRPDARPRTGSRSNGSPRPRHAGHLSRRRGGGEGRGGGGGERAVYCRVYHAPGATCASGRSAQLGPFGPGSASSSTRSTSPATRPSRPSTGNGCRWSRSTAGAGRVSRHRMPCGGAVAQAGDLS